MPNGVPEQTRGSNAMLNQAGFHSIAAVAYTIEWNRYREAALDAEISISDCDRRVTLEFGFSVPDQEFEYENGLYKINTLIGQLEAFRDDYIEMATKYVFSKKKKRKKKKKGS